MKYAQETLATFLLQLVIVISLCYLLCWDLAVVWIWEIKEALDMNKWDTGHCGKVSRGIGL